MSTKKKSFLTKQPFYWNEKFLERKINLSINVCLRGGKGGFGSLLRSMGKALKRFTNFGAQRDLQGRRLRDIKAEKDLDEWLKNHKPFLFNKKKEIFSSQLARNKILNNSESSVKINAKEFVLPIKLCPFRDNCKYMWKCKYIHTSELAKQKQNPKFDQQKFKDQKNLNRKLDFKFDLSKHILEGIQGLKKKRKVNQDILKKKDEPVKHTLKLNTHVHELKFGVRKFVYLVCDECGCYFNGASWFCKNGCDFDLCLACSAIRVNKKVDHSLLMKNSKKRIKCKKPKEKDLELFFLIEIIHMPINLLWVVSAPLLKACKIQKKRSLKN